MRKKFRCMICILISFTMLTGLCACGEKKPADPNFLDFGKYDLYYKGSCIMYSETGKDALVLTFDFTNNSKESASFGLSLNVIPVQNDVQMESTYVVTDLETYAGVSNDFFTTVEPGNTLEVSTSYRLEGTDEVTVTLSDNAEKHIYTLTIDPTTLERVENEYFDAVADWDLYDENASDDNVTGDEIAGDEITGDKITDVPSEKLDASFADWWDGDWYGWWYISEADGKYADYNDYWWDAFARITVYDDLTGYLEIWDEDSSYDSLNGVANVSFSNDGEGEHGTMVSSSGQYMSVALDTSEWSVDPIRSPVDNMIVIRGNNTDDYGSYSYAIFLRPWGILWDDVDDEALPYSYEWYQSLVASGASMPDLPSTAA